MQRIRIIYISRSHDHGGEHKKSKRIRDRPKIGIKYRHLREYLIRKYNYVLNDRREKEYIKEKVSSPLNYS
jgi:hypothetical protein